MNKINFGTKRKEIVFHIHFMDLEIRMGAKFSREGWETLMSKMEGKTIVIHSFPGRDDELGFIAEMTNMGPLVKFQSKIISNLHTSDPWTNTTSKLCSRGIVEQGTFSSISCLVEQDLK